MSEFSHVLGSNPQTGAIPQVVVDWLAENLPDSGTSGSGILNVSGTVDLPNEPGIREVYATAAATVEGVALAAGDAAVFRYLAGEWNVIVIGQDTYWKPASGYVPPPDTTAPSVAALTVSGSGTSRTLTASGVTDAGGLHALPYAFSTDDGASWSAWQAGPTYTVTGDGTYQPRVKVRDAAGNETTVSAASFTIDYANSWGSYYADTFTAPDGTLLIGKAMETAPTPTVYQALAGETGPVITNGQFDGTGGTAIKYSAASAYFAGGVVSVAASEHVRIEASWTSGAMYSDGIGLVLFGQDLSYFQLLTLSANYQGWATVIGNIPAPESGSSIPFTTEYVDPSPSHASAHTLLMDITRNGNTASMNLTVDGVTRLTGYTMNLLYTGTIFGVGCRGQTTSSTSTVTSWSIRAE